MADYTYLACNLLTDEPLEELPLSGVSFERQLGVAGGQLKARLRLGDRRWPTDRMLLASRPARTALWVGRNGQLVWGGIVWTRNRRTGELSVGEFGSYFARRRIRATLTYTGVDQLAIARDLLTQAMAVPNSVQVELDGAVLSGVPRDRTYPAAERKAYAEAIDQLASVDGGFDVRVDVSGDLDNRHRVLRLGYPKLGRRGADSGLLLELPGNVSDYSWLEDGSETSTLADAIGASDGNLELIGTATRPDLELAGYPRLERTDSYSDVSEQATLDAHATADLAAVAGVPVYPSLTIRANAEPVLGTYDPGDDVRLRVTDDGFPRPAGGGAGLDTYLRILGISCQPTGASGDEKVALTVGGVLP